MLADLAGAHACPAAVGGSQSWLGGVRMAASLCWHAPAEEEDPYRTACPLSPGVHIGHGPPSPSRWSDYWLPRSSYCSTLLGTVTELRV